MATLEEATGWLAARGEALKGLEQTVKLDLKGQGFIHVSREGVTNEDAPADLVVRVSLDDLKALADRRLDPARAMLTGRLKLSNMGLAMKMKPVLKTLFG